MRSVTLAVTLFLLQASAAAIGGDDDPPAGRVKRIEGQVTLDRRGQVQPVEVGAPVYAGDRIRTGHDGSVGVTLSDDTRLSAGPRSSLLINEFRFNATTYQGSLLTTLLSGTFSVVTGLIGKQSPQNVRFKTPTVVLGIRGTEFIVDTRGVEE